MLHANGKMIKPKKSTSNAYLIPGSVSIQWSWHDQTQRFFPRMHLNARSHAESNAFAAKNYCTCRPHSSKKQATARVRCFLNTLVCCQISPSIVDITSCCTKFARELASLKHIRRLGALAASFSVNIIFWIYNIAYSRNWGSIYWTNSGASWKVAANSGSNSIMKIDLTIGMCSSLFLNHHLAPMIQEKHWTCLISTYRS
jgi:hypothetical protein